jgi:UDP-N-acetylmuramate--alanine ligase
MKANFMNDNLKKNRRVHFVGIKGVAMAALAVWYKEAGFAVTGSDVEEEFPTDEVLAKAKISVLGFDTKNITNSNPGLVIYTGAHGGRENDEVIEAKALGISVLPHGIALGRIMEGKKQISVAGSHGKTTTTAMIATILYEADRDPSWAVGCGEIRGLGLPGHFGRGDCFVAEADEYVTDPGHDSTPRFMWQHPDVLVVTNIDFDHPDVYDTLADVQVAFAKFQKQAKMTVSAKDFEVTHVGFGDERTFFTLSQNGMNFGEFTLRVPGVHNAQNAGAAAIAAKELGLSRDQIAKGLLKFGGTKRRFEIIGRWNGAKLIDDYAHHPNEIKATLASAHDWYPGARIIAVFQPHTYSRTKALMHEFAGSFANAREVLLTDIYASAREHDTLGISARTLVEETAKRHQSVRYAPDFVAVRKILTDITHPGDIIIFMGAGSIYTWAHSMI